MKFQFAALFLGAPCATAGPPGKSTIVTSDAMSNLDFMLKYLPVTVAEDNGVGNEARGTIQGRAQVLRDGYYTEPNCQLHSSSGATAASSSHVAMTQNGLGNACSYTSGQMYGSSGAMHMVYAHNQVQCCNACVATKGCIAAMFKTSANDHSGGQGPQSWEGFGLHQPDVLATETTGGLSVDQLTQKYVARLGDHSVFDAFMDYSVTFFVSDFQEYVDAFKADGVSHFLGQWSDGTDTWYSLIFNVAGGTYVIELVSKVKPSGSSSLPLMEQRMSPDRCDKYRNQGNSPTNVLLIASINRAASDIANVDDVHTNLFKMPTSHSISGDVTRHCYEVAKGSSETFDVCFTNRESDADKDAIFSVRDHENNMWGVHAGTMGDDPHVHDKMSSHGGYSIPSEGITALQSYFASNDPFPITNSTRLAYACFQCYVIDPTGFSIQSSGPRCNYWSKCNGAAVV